MIQYTTQAVAGSEIIYIIGIVIGLTIGSGLKAFWFMWKL